MQRLLQWLWQSFPSSIKQLTLKYLGDAYVRACIRGERRKRSPAKNSIIVVSGFFSETLGIGRAGEMTARQLELCGFTVIRHDLRPLLNARGMRSHTLPGPVDATWVLHCNPPEAIIALARLSPDTLEQKYRIGYWAWELPTAPDSWIAAGDYFDEIWAPSTFCASSFALCRCVVRVLPHPVPDLHDQEADRGKFGIPDGPVAFIAFADFRSSRSRKNPLGAVEAYLRAFPQPSTALLVVKLLAEDHNQADIETLSRHAATRDDILILAERLSDNDAMTLLASCDVFVSLHRAEGFGLVIAEAMSMGKPVVVTHWSGNCDFTEALPFGKVPFRLVPVHDEAGLYDQPGEMWADPDLDAAADLLKAAHASASLRAEAGKAGRRLIEQCRHRWDTIGPPHGQTHRT